MPWARAAVRSWVRPGVRGYGLRAAGTDSAEAEARIAAEENTPTS
ncbi:hypothetical protein [Streptomyces yokosukanensis]|nr:hypothetical protein [Streptomyces yokosukanensis]